VGEAIGGGIDDDSGMPGTLGIGNSIVAGNTAPASVDVNSASANSLGYNLIGDGTGSTGFTNTDLVGTAANPINPFLGPLQDNGGPTETMALLPGSPAIAAGALTDMEWDQRGPGYPREVNDATDIGAYEVQNRVNNSTPAAHPGLFAESGIPLPRSLHGTVFVPAAAVTAPSTARVPPVVAAVDKLFALPRSQHAGFWWFRPVHTGSVEGNASMRDVLAPSNGSRHGAIALVERGR
jgi:hypothetical protein